LQHLDAAGSERVAARRGRTLHQCSRPETTNSDAESVRLRRGLGALARPGHYRSSIPDEPLERLDETAADPGKVSLRGVVCRLYRPIYIHGVF